MHPESGIESSRRGKVSTVTWADLKQRDAAVTSSVLLRPPRTPPRKKGYHRSVSLPTHWHQSRNIPAHPLHWLWGKKRPHPSTTFSNIENSDNTNNRSNCRAEDSTLLSATTDSHLLLPELFSDDWSEYSDDDNEEIDADSSERLFGLEILENHHE
jgi:hypothetical protein